ncbi:linear amide C-N hydrolase [Lactobacillus helveticus]|uniref:linear amide C-N hydrolase n=1 Tax=Lactobacillus helveticus TaxID=1587 RepID=UPI0021A3A97D|nr:linear amide C-N hydrolase [Lactobacillus helveticus]
MLGGMDSSSRFVKVAFTLAHAPKSDDETESVTNFFNILHSSRTSKEIGRNRTW